MKSITIHNLDEELSLKIQEKAQKEGISLNRAIKDLLAQALCLKPYQNKNVDDFQEFLEIWSENEYQKFQEKMKVFN